MRDTLRIVCFLLCACLCLPAVSGQTAQSSSASPPAKSAAAVDPTQAGWHPTTDDLLPEVQKNVGKHQTIAFVWWMPAEYFEATQSGASNRFEAFRQNTVFAVAFAKIAPFGILDFSNLDKIKAAVSLRDAGGVEYKPIENVPENVRVPLEIMRPVFSASLGKLGENIQFLIFAGKDGSGKRVADPKAARDFSVLIKELAGEPETTVSWHVPLSAMFPPKYCPAGKERVEASWKFCPWHGVPLPQPQ